jgi:Uma2 family endonuclease
MEKPKTYLTPEEYLDIERKAEHKSEYFNGEIFALAGTSKEHNIIAGNLIAVLKSQLREKSCEVFFSELRVRVPSTSLYTYPDIIVVCGEQKFEDKEFDTLLNPTLIIEILSESTESYDRGKKFENYLQFESLQEYVLVSQKQVRIEKYLRQDKGKWLFSEERSLEKVIELPSIKCSFPLREVYRNINF